MPRGGRGFEGEMRMGAGANPTAGTLAGMAQSAVPGGMAQPMMASGAGAMAPTAMAQPAMARAASMSPAAMQEGATMGRAMQTGEGVTPPMAPQPAQPTQPPQPAQPAQPARRPEFMDQTQSSEFMGGAPGGMQESLISGTALTPPAPSATGGGSGSMPTATVGGEGAPMSTMGGASGGMSGGGESPMSSESPMPGESPVPSGPNTQSLTGAGTGGEVAQQFGFDAQEYGGYFTPISEQMKTAATEEGYSGMLNEQRAQLRQQSGQAKQGLRASLLQDAMMAQQAAGASGFAGGGAQQQALGLARQGRQLQADQLTSQYGRGMYGVRQQIAGRVVAGQQALASAQSAMYDRALQLQRSGADMASSGAGGGDGSVLSMSQPSPEAVATDTGIATSIGARQSATGGSQTDPTMNNIASGSGQGPNSFADLDNQLTGDAYDEMIVQQQEAARQAALRQTNNFAPPPRPKNIVINENKGRIGRG